MASRISTEKGVVACPAPARRESTAYVLERASYGGKIRNIIQGLDCLQYAVTRAGRTDSALCITRETVIIDTPPGVRHPLMKPYPSRLP